MISNKRIIKREGGYEVRLTLFISHEEMEGVERINPEKETRLDSMRTKCIDMFLCYLRIMVHEIDIWTNHTKVATRMAQHKKLTGGRDATKNGKKNRVRRNRKKG